jgi:predicted enzyme related to lactoylglutathione lyase
MGRPVIHWELLSKDRAKISDFYEKVFDWNIQHIPEMNYRFIETGARAASTAASCSRRATSLGPAT